VKQFEAETGTWKIVDETVTALIGASLRAYTLAGSETEKDLIFEVTAKLVAGTKIGLIMGYSLTLANEENFIEAYLDIAAQKLKIDLIVADVRQNVAVRDYALAVDTEYKLKGKLTSESDGSASFTFYVEGVAQFVVIDDLATVFQTAAGIYGLMAEGTLATNNGVFSKIRKYTAETLYCTLDQAREVLKTDDTLLDFDEEIVETIQIAMEMVDAQLAVKDLTASSTSKLIQQATAHFAAYLYRRKRDPVGAEAFKAEAEKFLADYVGSENYDEPGVRHG